MRLVGLWLGKWKDKAIIWRILSIEFGIEPKIDSPGELERYIRDRREALRVEVRYAEKPYGEAGDALKQVLALFDRLREELGEERFDYELLPREQVTVDLSHCKRMDELWLELRRKMEWEDWYGENLDALWDILTGLPYRGDDFVILRPRRYTGSLYGDDEGFTERVDEICGVFQSAQARGDVTVELRYTDETNEAARNDSCPQG